jgi:hypothetical protein
MVAGMIRAIAHFTPMRGVQALKTTDLTPAQRAALRVAERQFRFYAEQHLQKQPPERGRPAKREA